MSNNKPVIPHHLFVQDESQIWIQRPITNSIVDHISAKVYSPIFDPRSGKMGLTEAFASFKQSSKERYGEISLYRDRIVKEARENGKDGPVGVMAVGRVGSGKSLLGEDISNKRLQEGIPVIYVADGFPIGILHQIVRGIVSSGQPLTVFLDEFGKFYSNADEDRQTEAQHAQLLQMLSDNSLTNVLFYLTSNETDKFATLGLNNRPSRILFKIPVDYLEVTSYIDMIDRSNVEKEISDFLFLNMLERDLKRLSDGFNTDVLQTILKKVYRQGITTSEMQAESIFYNIPQLEYHTFTLEDVQTGSTSSQLEYTFVSMENDILKISYGPDNKIIQTKINMRQVVKDSFFLKTTNQGDSEANIFIPDEGKIHSFRLTIRVCDKYQHGQLQANFTRLPKLKNIVQDPDED